MPKLLSSRWGYWSLLPISVLVIVIDILTKQYFHNNFTVGERQDLLPFLSLTLHYNPGAAFSFLANAGGWQKYFFSFMAIAVSGYLVFWLKRMQSSAELLLALSFSFIIGGALGNLHDRLRWDQVVDFISLHWRGWYFPTFNVADMAITLGAVLFIIDVLFFEPKRRVDP